MTTRTKRILVVGVGGQGVIFASKVLAEAHMRKGMDVIMSEVHGMAQRGGTVTCHLNIGGLHSSIIGDGAADVLISFEPIETYRALDKANKDTVILMSQTPLVPTSANVGEVKYPDPEEVLAAIRDVNEHVHVIDATAIAQKAGSSLTANTVMLGALAGTNVLDIGPEVLKEQIIERSPDRIVELNKKAFDLGHDSV